MSCVFEIFCIKVSIAQGIRWSVYIRLFSNYQCQCVVYPNIELAFIVNCWSIV